MKCKFLLIAIIAAAVWLAGCSASRGSQTPSLELKKRKVAYPITDSFLATLFSQYPQYFDTLLSNNKWHIQIIYTKIDRKRNNKPVFTNYYYNVDPAQYYYPASTVKLPTAVLALQRMNELHQPGLDRNTTMITEAAFPWQTAVYNDPSSADGRPNIGQYVKKIFLVSDNDAFNRLYEFLGQEYINDHLHRMGYDSVQIIHHLDISLTEAQNRTANPVVFYDSVPQIIYQEPLRVSKLQYQKRYNYLGKGYYNGNGLVDQPFNFSIKNRFTLVDLHSVLRSVLFPKSVPRRQRFRLKEDDYRFLYRYMSMKPGESDYPQYDTSFTDAYSKLLLYGGHGKMDPDIRIFNKEGDAYGFLTDAAYVVDFRNNIEFMLSATIACNSDGIFNDDHYGYESTGYPFLKNLGRVIYQYELTRKRKNIPDLSAFKFNYGR